jgi:hypothetical protein
MLREDDYECTTNTGLMQVQAISFQWRCGAAILPVFTVLTTILSIMSGSLRMFLRNTFMQQESLLVEICQSIPTPYGGWASPQIIASGL